ncbi:hypothetical protein B0H15DRAFT_787191, partial [Mycena belliarum]
FPVENGLDQGDPFSGFAFLIYNADLAAVPRAANGEAGVVFVDDNTLIATGRTFKATHRKISRMLERPGGVADWAKPRRIHFGVQKYQCLDATRTLVDDPAHPGKKILDEGEPLLIDGHLVKPAPSVKLLGLHLDKALRWKQQFAAAVGKGHAWLAQFARLARPTRGITAGPMRRLYLAVCVPRMLYGADVFMSPPPAVWPPSRDSLGSCVSSARSSVVRGLQ